MLKLGVKSENAMNCIKIGNDHHLFNCVSTSNGQTYKCKGAQGFEGRIEKFGEGVQGYASGWHSASIEGLGKGVQVGDI